MSVVPGYDPTRRVVTTQSDLDRCLLQSAKKDRGAPHEKEKITNSGRDAPREHDTRHALPRVPGAIHCTQLDFG